MDYLKDHPEIQLVRFVLFDSKTYSVYEKALKELMTTLTLHSPLGRGEGESWCLTSGICIHHPKILFRASSAFLPLGPSPGR